MGSYRFSSPSVKLFPVAGNGDAILHLKGRAKEKCTASFETMISLMPVCKNKKLGVSAEMVQQPARQWFQSWDNGYYNNHFQVAPRLSERKSRRLCAGKAPFR